MRAQARTPREARRLLGYKVKRHKALAHQAKTRCDMVAKERDEAKAAVQESQDMINQAVSAAKTRTIQESKKEDTATKKEVGGVKSESGGRWAASVQNRFVRLVESIEAGKTELTAEKTKS